MLQVLKRLVEVPTVTTREELYLNRLLELLPDNYLVIDKNIFVPGRSKFVFAAHYDTIGIVVEDYLGKDRYLFSKRGLIDQTEGNMFRTILDDREIIGIVRDQRLDLLDEIDELTELHPFQYYPEMMFSSNKIVSPNLDNKVGVAVLIDLLRSYEINVLLIAGEEQGTTRLYNVIRHLNNRDVICIDATSATNPHDDRGIEGISYRAVEGAGTGNIAPRDLVDMIRKYIRREAISYSIHQISDATTMYRYGIRAINISYPVRYLHSPKEVADRKDVDELIRLLANIIEDS